MRFPFPTPFLLAPMEGIGDRLFLEVIDRAGGAGALVSRFLRITRSAVMPDFKAFLPWAGQTPLVIQLLGRDPARMAAEAARAEALGAGGIDLNFGCPSSTVTKKGCGAALLADPEKVRAIISAVRAAVTVPLSVKLRSGIDDSSTCLDLCALAADAGADLVILHPRTLRQVYKGSADWSLVAEAARRLPVPVCGNGDIATGGEAVQRLRESGAAAVMIGRGAAADPWIFRHAEAALAGTDMPPTSGMQIRGHYADLLRRYTVLYGGDAMALCRLKAHAGYLDRYILAPRGLSIRPCLRVRSGEEFLARLGGLLEGVG